MKKSIIILFSIFLFVFLLSFQKLPVADLWWLLESGKKILLSGRIFITDIFSFTAYGRPLIIDRWLSELIFYWIYSFSGISGLYVFKALILAFAFLLIYLTAIKKGANQILAWITTLVFAFAAQWKYFFDVRPYIFTYFFIAVFLYIFEKYKEKPSLIIFAIVPLQWLWANLHGGFMTGFALQIILFASLVLQRNQKRVKDITITLLLSFGASFINPSGVKLFLYPFSLLLLRESAFNRHLIEWIPPHQLYGWVRLDFFLIILTAIFILINIRKAQIFDILIFLTFSFLAVSGARHIPLFAIACTPVFAFYIQPLLERITSSHVFKFMKFNQSLSARIYLFAPLAFILLLLLLFLPRISRMPLENLAMEKTLFPYYAINFIKANNLQGRMFNPYEWGGYLMWRLYPQYLVFIDGRADLLYSEETYNDAISIMFGKDGWDSLLKKYGISFALCNLWTGNNELLHYKMQQSKDWLMIYKDDICAIFIRKSCENADLIKKLKEKKLVFPESPYLDFQQGQDFIKQGKLKEAIESFKKALELDPSYSKAYVSLGYIYGTMKNYDMAEFCFNKALEIEPATPRAHYNLGILYRKQSALFRAKSEFKKELEIDPDFDLAKKEIQNLEK